MNSNIAGSSLNKAFDMVSVQATVSPSLNVYLGSWRDPFSPATRVMLTTFSLHRFARATSRNPAKVSKVRGSKGCHTKVNKVSHSSNQRTVSDGKRLGKWQIRTWIVHAIWRGLIKITGDIKSGQDV